jgi:hypothetical protein
MAYKALNKKEVVKKVSNNKRHDLQLTRQTGFQIVCYQNWNLSHETLRSFKMQEKLCNLWTSNDYSRKNLQVAATNGQ